MAQIDPAVRRILGPTGGRQRRTFRKALSTYRGPMSNEHPEFHVNAPTTIIGRHVRNDGPGSAKAIPALWQEVLRDDALADIPGKISSDVYAVYTHLENAGISNEGFFSFVIGVPVSAGTPVPYGMTLVSIPQSRRAKFAVPNNDPARVIEAWERAWAYDDHAKTFVCEYELYSESGEVSVNLGVRGPIDHEATREESRAGI